MSGYPARGYWTATLVSVVATLVACGGGSPPELEDVDDQVVAVGSELVLQLRATDPDADPIEYGFAADVPDIASRATLSRTPSGDGTFRWRPVAADVGLWHFDFTASDGDHTTTLPVVIEVRSAIGAETVPVFLEPLGTGTTLDLAVRDCLDLAILVQDQDSVAVTITQEEPVIEGATLDQTGPFAASWRWCPTRAQIDAEDRYTLTLAADDGDNPRTIKNYLVVLRRPPPMNCPGDPPVISHTPMNVSQVVDLTIDAQISDDLGLKQPPLLYYATTAPANPPDLGAMTQVTMLLITGNMRSGTWAADVPNPAAGLSAGSSRTLYYVIVANDDDDPEGACDHETRSPPASAHQMTVTNPGGSGNLGLCATCSADIQCGDGDDYCVRVGQTNHCLRSCSGAGDCPAGYTCSAQPVTSVGGASGRQCVPSSGSCTMTTTCIDDFFEDNDSRTQAAGLPDLDPDTYQFVSCPLPDGSNDDEDWFPIVLTADATVTITLAGQSVSDLDLGLYDATGTRLASATGPTSNEMVSRCLTAGTYYIRVYAWGAGVRNEYSLTYARQNGSCASACVDDSREPDDDAASARAITYPVYTSTGNQICAGDDDWYRVLLFDDEQLIVDLTFNQASASQDLDVHLYNSAGTNLTPCSPQSPGTCQLNNGQSADSNERFTFTAPASCSSLCTYYVVIRGWNNSQNAYDIRIEVP
ncbi:MAG: pre-peptidase C-terminal domain-containing protein [Kofleriaceae bacterium]|nr:pre-peptidase C-terminal domain-containing protein [Kofleriaceae bacterium]MCL4227396.1 pre-peptidase C-terminal domain-containing protein [Myxococcales bacterium]